MSWGTFAVGQALGANRRRKAEKKRRMREFDRRHKGTYDAIGNGISNVFSGGLAVFIVLSLIVGILAAGLKFIVAILLGVIAFFLLPHTILIASFDMIGLPHWLSLILGITLGTATVWAITVLTVRKNKTRKVEE